MKLTTALLIGVFTAVSTQAIADPRHVNHHYCDHPNQGKYAGHQHRNDRHHGEDRSYRDRYYGRVVHVEPVYRSYTRTVPGASCLSREPERVHYVSYTGTVLGAVIGGALGHRIGDAHGDPGVAAIAGGLLGASIGRGIDRTVSYNQGLRVAGPCRVNQRRETVRKLVEYKVTYRYNGRVHHARMDHDPGEWVKLDVDVSPA